MPTYEYRCESCKRNFDVVQSFHDDPLTACPTCAAPVRKVFGNVGIVFKGSGFYKTDSRPGDSPKPTGEPSPTPADGSEASGSDGKGTGGSDGKGTGGSDGKGTPGSKDKTTDQSTSSAKDKKEKSPAGATTSADRPATGSGA